MMQMIDIHSHILPQIDDGARSIQESVNMIVEAKKAGFSKIVSTSHYEEEMYEADIDKRMELIDKIKQELNKKSVDMQIYIGAELFVSKNVLKLIDNKKVSTLNNTKYLLIEFPRNNKLIYMEEILFQVLSKGITPIIAHPERYIYVQKEPNIVLELIKKGVLFQSNYASLLGYYGKQAQVTLKKLLKHKMIHFMATDAHREHSIYSQIDIALKKLEKIITREEIMELSSENPQKVIENKDILVEEPIKIGGNLIEKIFWN